MPSNEQRVATLESKAALDDQSIRVVIAEVGETTAQALGRDGIEPGAEHAIVVTFG